MARPSPLSTPQVVALAAVAGIAWGVVMAVVAWRADGTEIVLLQGWILGAAFALGTVAPGPRAGAIAGLAVVGAAIWTYELLPGWGVEATIARQGFSAAQVEALAARFDAEDIVLVSTHLIGAVIGLGAALRRPVAAPAPPPPPAAPAAEPPLWARLERPPEPTPPPAPAPPPQRRTTVPAPRRAAPFLLAALGTDFLLDRVFGMYSTAQAAGAGGLLVIGAGATIWLARRRAPVALLIGALLALAFAAVQHAEYQDRQGPDLVVVS